MLVHGDRHQKDLRPGATTGAVELASCGAAAARQRYHSSERARRAESQRGVTRFEQVAASVQVTLARSGSRKSPVNPAALIRT
jgi:hypothetical protein